MANSIKLHIQAGKIRKEDSLPSLNDLSYHLEISRDRQRRATKQLGILGFIPEKGYFIKIIQTINTLRVFLLFNKLSVYKKLLYDAIVKGLGYNSTINLYVYSNDFPLFKKMLANKLGQYDYYVCIHSPLYRMK